MAQPTYKQGSVTITAFFDRVLFELSQGSYLLQEKLFATLENHGLKLEEIQVENAFAGPGNWSLSMKFLSFRAELLLKVDRYEITLLNPGLGERDVITNILQSIEGAIKVCNEVAMKARHFVYFAHYDVPGGFQSITSRFAANLPDGLGDVTGHGLSLYLREPSFSDEATVVLDKSITVPQGLFLTMRCSFKSEFDLERSAGNFYTYLTKVLGVFDLTVPQ